MKYSSVAVAVILVALVGVAFAQRAPEERQVLQLFKRMQLTEEQRAKVADLGAEMQKKMVSLKADQATLRIDLRQLFRAKELDRAAIEKKAKAVAELEVKQRMLKLDNWFAVNALLTQEQQPMWKKALVMNQQQKGPKEGPRPERERRGQRTPEPRP